MCSNIIMWAQLIEDGIQWNALEEEKSSFNQSS